MMIKQHKNNAVSAVPPPPTDDLMETLNLMIADLDLQLHTKKFEKELENKTVDFQLVDGLSDVFFYCKL